MTHKMQRILPVNFFQTGTRMCVTVLLGLSVFPGIAFSDSNELTAAMAATYQDKTAQKVFTTLGTTRLNIMNAGMQDSLYATSLTGYSGDQNSYVIARHMFFCSPDITKEKALWSCSADDDNTKGGDVKISTLLSTPILTPVTGLGALLIGDKTTALIRNFINPFPAAQLSTVTDPTSLDPTNKANYDSKAAQNFAQALGYETLLSVPRYSLATMMAKRQSNSNLTKPDPSDPLGKKTLPISFIQYMEDQSANRLFNPTWSSNMDTSANQANLAGLALIEADRAKMQAFQLWMAVEQYKQMERIEALLSAMVVQNVRGAQAAAAALNH